MKRFLIFLLAFITPISKTHGRHRWRVAKESNQPSRVIGEQRNRTNEKSATDDNCYCGISREVESDKRRFRSRIVGGGDVSEGEIPWQAALLEFGDLGKLLCGAVLVSSRHVLTAGHCIMGRPITTLAVALGFTDLKQTVGNGRIVVRVSRVNIHPDYKGAATNHQADLAVVTLSDDVDFSKNKLVAQVCLPKRPQSNVLSKRRYNGRQGKISGWGLTSFFFGTFPTRLQQTTITVLGDDCGELSDHHKEGQLCAGGDERDACQGDSGGPLVVEENDAAILVGLVSAGSQCGVDGLPGVYTDVNYYWRWIKDQIADGEKCTHLHPEQQKPEESEGGTSTLIPPGDTDPATSPDSSSAEQSAKANDTTTTSPITTTTTTFSSTTSKEHWSDVVLLIGGNGYARGTGVEVWSPTCSHVLPRLPFSRHGAEAVEKRGNVVLCGGGRGKRAPNCLTLSSSLHWEPFRGRGWSPVAHTRACLASLERGMVMQTGGVDNTAWLWHPGVEEGWWERLADLPRRLYSHACAYHPQEGRVLIAGGSDGFHIRRETYIFQLAAIGSWQRGPDLRQPRWWASLVVVNGVFTILGGEDRTRFIPAVEQLEDGRWQSMELPLIQPRSNFAAVVLQQELVQQKFKQLVAICAEDPEEDLKVP